MISLQNDYDKGKPLTTKEIINEANYKYNKLISCKEYQYQKHKYLNLTTDQHNEEKSKDKSRGSGPIELWCKSKIKDQAVVKRNGKTWHQYSHHKNEEYSFLDSLYICSHTPEEYDEWSKTKDMFYYRKERLNSSSKDNAKSGLVIVDKLRRVLTTANPTLTPEQIEGYI